VRELKELQIGDFTYTVQQLPTTRSLKLFHRLAGALAPALGSVASALAETGGNVGNLDIMVAAKLIGPAMGSLFDKISPEQMVEITKELMQGCVVTGEGVENPNLDKQPVFDSHFAGRLQDVYKLLKFSLEVNYGDFFAELLAFAVKYQKPATAKASLSLQS
jgi:hypothetical protein